MSTFANYKLVIPDLWTKQWQEAIDQADGASKGIVTTQARAASLLSVIDDSEATPERVAWLTIWTRAFSILEGLLGASTRNSTAVIDALDRMSFEGILHIEAILEPISSMWKAKSKGLNVVVSGEFEEKAWLQVRERLRAYTAWCLWNDRGYYTEMLKESTLAGVWDPTPGLRLIAARRKMPGIENLLYPVNIDTDEKALKAGRSNMKGTLHSRLARCDMWLGDSRLARWTQRLQELTGKVRSPSFFQLFVEETRGIAKRLDEVERRYSYPQYMAGSMVIHGSSIDRVLSINNDSVFPAFVDSEEACHQLINNVGSTCNSIIMFLGLIQKILWG